MARPLGDRALVLPGNMFSGPLPDWVQMGSVKCHTLTLALALVRTLL